MEERKEEKKSKKGRKKDREKGGKIVGLTQNAQAGCLALCRVAVWHVSPHEQEVTGAAEACTPPNTTRLH